MPTLRHLLRLLPASLRLMVAYARAYRYWATSSRPLLQAVGGHALSPREMARIRHYHYGTTYLAALFEAYMGRRHTAQEREGFFYLAALAAFFDDLTDQVSALPPSSSPEDFGAEHDARGFSLRLLARVRERVAPESRTAFEQSLKQVFEAETSPTEANECNALGIKNLIRQSARKGGASVLLFRSLLAVPPGEEEQLLWQGLGALIQYTDDLFDLWHDARAGIATPATYWAARNEMSALTRQTQLLIEPVSDAAGRACGEVHFLVALTQVCLHHYARLWQQYGTLPLQERRLMVVDMELWPNRWRMVAELLRSRSRSTTARCPSA